MSKQLRRAKTTRKRVSKNQEEWPLVVYVWIGGLLFVDYFGAEVLLATHPHPIHWLGGALAGVLGYFVGQVWYRWRGDSI